MLLFVLFLFLFHNGAYAFFWSVLNNGTSYKNYQIWQIKIDNNTLSPDFEENIAKQDVFHRSDNNIDFLLNGNETEYWNKFLESQNISYAVLLDDVQRAIDREGLMKNHGSWRRGGKLNWTTYPKLSDIYEYIKSVAATNSKYCTTQTLRQTLHKKNIQMLKLSTGNPSNRAILVEAGMHGREWVAVSSLLYFIEQIAWNFTAQPEYIRNKDWYIIPVSNPDGYEYSMTTDRMWRKNRRRFSGECDGVDLNRNFDVKWGQKVSSTIMCSIEYCGPEPFSEQETIALKDLASSRHFYGYVGIHSYGSTVYYPYTSPATGSLGLHTKVAKDMVMAMRRVAKEHFRAGTVNQLRGYQSSGMALDWMYTRGVRHTYLMETRGGRSGQFFLEANQILPSAREITAGLFAMAQSVQ